VAIASASASASASLQRSNLIADEANQVVILPNTIFSSFTHFCCINSQICVFLQICKQNRSYQIRKNMQVSFSLFYNYSILALS
jgi:hypothetical protein